MLTLAALIHAFPEVQLPTVLLLGQRTRRLQAVSPKQRKEQASTSTYYSYASFLSISYPIYMLYPTIAIAQ